ncbi:hypothetical protein [Segatella oris]|nr:hypothetical protein [Segatella oris]
MTGRQVDEFYKRGSGQFTGLRDEEGVYKLMRLQVPKLAANKMSNIR